MGGAIGTLNAPSPSPRCSPPVPVTRRQAWMLSPSWGRLVSPDTGRADGEGKRGERDEWMVVVVPFMPGQRAGMASSTNDSASWTTTPSTHTSCVVYLYPYLYLCPPCSPSSAPLGTSSLPPGAVVTRTYAFSFARSLYFPPCHRQRPCSHVRVPPSSKRAVGRGRGISQRRRVWTSTHLLPRNMRRRDAHSLLLVCRRVCTVLLVEVFHLGPVDPWTTGRAPPHCEPKT